MGLAVVGIIILVFAIFVAACAAKKQSETKEVLAQTLKDNGFISSKVIGNGDGMTLYVDDVNKKWFVQLSRIDSTPYFFNYEDLLEFEVYEDGNSIAKGRAGSALVGGVLFGAVGAVVGGSRSRAIKSTCTTLQVRIRVNDISVPEIVVPFIKMETPKSSLLYKSAFDLAKSFAATLAYIQNGKEVKYVDSAEQQSQSKGSEADELEKYYSLYEKGIISEEEFNEKKKQLLGL